MTAKTLTVRQILDCGIEADGFLQEFGHSVEVSEALCRQYATAFKEIWRTEDLVPAVSREAFRTAKHAANEAWNAAIAAADAAYREPRSRRAAWRAWSEYEDAAFAALLAYDGAVAAAFARAYAAES